MKLDKFNKKILQYKIEHVYIIFYKDGCPYCEDAMELLDSMNLRYKGYNLNKIPGGKEEAVKNFSKHSQLTNFDKFHNTVPIIFYKGEFIGGFSNLEQFLELEVLSTN